jgi:hypothetical protein
MKPRHLLLLTLGVSTFGCGDDTGAGGGGGEASSTSDGATSTTSAATATSTSSGAGGESADRITFDISTRVEAGEEVQLCKYVAMPTDRGDMAASRGSHTYSDGSHHFLVYRTTFDDVPAGGDELHPCDESAWMSDVRGVAYAAQTPEGELALPEGVSQRFAPGEVLLFQTHYLNAGVEPLDASMHLAFDLVDPAEAPVEAGVFFFFNPVIHVPPRGESTSRLSCPVTGDVDLVFAVSHMHARGVGYEAHVEGEAEGSLYASDEWAEPVSRVFAEGEAGARLEAGSKITYACDYANTGDATYQAGPSATSDEMCMFIGMYYPRLDTETELCWNGLAETEGSTSCLDTVACNRGCAEGDAECAAQCTEEVCPNGAIPLMRFAQCVGPTCGETCATEDAATCQSCVIGACPEEALACQAATCEPEPT